MWGLAPALLIFAASDPAAVFKMSDKATLALAVLTPAGAKPRLSYSELARTVELVVGVHTDLAPTLLENVVVESCGGKLSCIARLAISAEGAQSARASLLLVLSVLPGSERDLVGAAVIDLVLYRSLAETVVGDPAREDMLEAAIAERGLIAPEERRQIETLEDMSLFLEGLVEGGWRPGLTRLGHWEPYGAIELGVPRADAVLRVDEAVLGGAKEGVNRIERVHRGSRRLSLQLPDFLPFEQTVEVVAGQTSSVEAVLVPSAGSYTGARAVVLWTGVGATALGVALLIVRQTSVRRPYVCVAAAGCDGSAYEARGLLGLGAGLGGGGGAMAISTLLIGDDSSLPWIQVVLGLGAGLLAGWVTTWL